MRQELIICRGSAGSGMQVNEVNLRPGQAWGAVRSLGPATRCDTIIHLRWDVLKPMPCIKIACDALRCIFQHVGNFAPDFVISQQIIIRFSNGFYHNAGYLMGFHLICVSKVCVIYF